MNAAETIEPQVTNGKQISTWDLEAQNPKFETNPKHECPNDQNNGVDEPCFEFWILVIRICLELGASDFEFRPDIVFPLFT